MPKNTERKEYTDTKERVKQAEAHTDSVYKNALWELQNNRQAMNTDRLLNLIQGATMRSGSSEQLRSSRDEQLATMGIELLYEVFKTDDAGKHLSKDNLPKLDQTTIANTLKLLLENPQINHNSEQKRIKTLYNFISCYKNDISPEQIKEISVKHPNDFNKLLARAIEKGDIELFNKLAAASPEAAHSALINADRMPQGFLEVLANQKSSDNNPTATALLSSLMLLQREHPITLQDKNPKDHKNKMALHDLIQRCPGKSVTDIKKDIDATKWSGKRAAQSIGKDYSHNLVSRGPLNDGLNKISASVKPNQKSTPQPRVKCSQPAGHSGLRADTQRPTPVPKAPKHN